LLCEIDINECDSQPCKNGGKCSNLLNCWTCDCPTGYFEDDCGLDFNECQSNPCKNLATCID
jgi:hypothetical protein